MRFSSKPPWQRSLDARVVFLSHLSQKSNRLLQRNFQPIVAQFFSQIRERREAGGHESQTQKNCLLPRLSRIRVSREWNRRKRYYSVSKDLKTMLKQTTCEKDYKELLPSLQVRCGLHHQYPMPGRNPSHLHRENLGPKQTYWYADD